MMGRFIWRMFLIPFAFIVAGLVAGAVLLTLGYEYIAESTAIAMDDPGALMEGWFNVAEDVSRFAVYMSGATILPAILIVIVGEVAGIRSSVYYIVGAGLAMAALPFLFDLSASREITETARGAMPAFATSGFAGGLVYWLLAGRTA
ncbi:MAG: hypothetical protein AAFZ01_09235 [Pseudomonadota bacterium]